ncbi:MAG: ATP-binding cassette domain-containing protein [Oligoflexales bacterium]|nr:ATP-binding cassette domain-containing protein [Oligoflexales bacterium]
MEALLELRDLSFGIRAGKVLISKLSLELAPRSVIFVRGPNGLGKSTLLKVLADPSAFYCQGDILYSPVLKSRPVYIPQNYDTNLHIPLSLGDIISAGCHGRSIEDLNLYGLLTEKDLRLAWQTASGGEKQKTVIVRLLNQSRQILLLDEPTNHLDQHSRELLWRALDDYLGDKAAQRSALIVLHGEDSTVLRKLETFTVDLNQYRVII